MLRQRDAAKREGRKCREVLKLLFLQAFRLRENYHVALLLREQNQS